MVPGLPTAYCDVAYAETINGGGEVWDAVNETEKENALQWARVYMDAVYTYTVEFEEDAAPETIQTANALLAVYQLQGELFPATDTSRGTTMKRVKAGPVESEVEYDPYLSSNWVDPAPYVTMLLSEYATSTSSGSSNVFLVRS